MAERQVEAMEGNRSRVGWRQTRQCLRERLKTVRERDGKVDTLLRERRVWIGNTDEWGDWRPRGTES